MAGTCLIVDDDPMFVEIFARVVRPFGLAPTIVGDVPSATSALMQRDFDLVFLDIRLGDADGRVVIEAIRHSKPHMLRRIIVVTGYPGARIGLPPELIVIDKSNLSGIGDRVAAVIGVDR
jgi:ActR/RegA family two-component response regulator